MDANCGVDLRDGWCPILSVAVIGAAAVPARLPAGDAGPLNSLEPPLRKPMRDVGELIGDSFSLSMHPCRCNVAFTEFLARSMEFMVKL